MIFASKFAQFDSLYAYLISLCRVLRADVEIDDEFFKKKWRRFGKAGKF